MLGGSKGEAGVGLEGLQGYVVIVRCFALCGGVGREEVLVKPLHCVAQQDKCVLKGKLVIGKGVEPGRVGAQALGRGSVGGRWRVGGGVEVGGGEGGFIVSAVKFSAGNGEGV